MRTPYHGTLQPFRLRSNVVFFHDWRYVWHGSSGWRTGDGHRVPMWATGSLPTLRFADNDTPTGIRLRAMPASKSEPFLRPESPLEGMIVAPTVIHENGLHRLWYGAVPPASMDAPADGAADRQLLLYAESDDGATWRRPALGLSDDPKLAHSNLVYGGSLGPDCGVHGGGVFVDPSAAPEARYKLIHQGACSREMMDDYAARYSEIDPHAERLSKGGAAVFGAVSPDGIKWTALAEPLVLQVSDTHNIAYYDAFLKKYVGYFRTWVMGRRAIGRAESDDFSRFPLPETILWPDASLGATDTWYANGRTSYPGADDYHLLFAKRWCVGTDRFHVHLLTSPDGILWGFPPENEVVTPGSHGEWDGGGVSVGCGMVELPDERVGVPLAGFHIPHKYPRRPPLGAIGWATWERDRLVALEAEEKGSFRTPQLLFDGSELRLNASTRHAGEVRVEVVGHDDEVLPGFSFEDCRALTGDFADRVVTWGDHSSIPREEGEPVSFRVRLRQAQLFSMRMR